MLNGLFRFLLTLITDILTRGKRDFFRFFDGSRWRAVDPLPIARALFTHAKFDWDETPKLLRSQQATVEIQAAKVIAEAVREVFAIAPAERGGLTELECVDLLGAFQEYLGNVKKNGSLFRISSEPTDQQSSPDFPMPAPLPSADQTKHSSDSGSTQVEQSRDLHGSPAEGTPV